MNLTPEQAKQILQKIEAEKARSAASASAVPRAPAIVAKPDAPQVNTLASENDHAALPPVQGQFVDESLVHGNWVVDGLVDVAPASPQAASPGGVVLVNRNNDLLVAHLSSLSKEPTPGETPIQPIAEGAGSFALARGPALADGYGYWISTHFLYRRPTKVPYGPLEELAADARVGTRAAALPASKATGRPTWVGYIALPTVVDGPLRAKLWYGAQDEAVLTEPSASALSIQLVEIANLVYVVTLEARTGQSTLHARTLEPGSPPKLGADHVVWVGGSPNSMTELSLKPTKNGSLLGLLPVERDVTTFALGVLSFTSLDAATPPSERWLPYLNGINPAPVEASRVCGHDTLLFARPSTADPGSPQELVLLDLEAKADDPPLVLGTSKAYFDVSIAELKRGALISYVADHRTWARTVRCVSG
jgi:hypothetical protein